MINYLFIECRDPFESTDVQFVSQSAADLKQRDNEVTVFLVQNGVLAARRNAQGTQLPGLSKAGIRVLADDFSLQERGIRTEEMLPGVQRSNIDALVDILVRENTRVIWH